MALLGRQPVSGGPQNWGDILSIIGAGLKDVSSPDGNALGQVQQMMAARQQFARQQAFQQQLTDLFSTPGANNPAAAPAIPTMKGPGVDGNPVSPGIPQLPGAGAPSPASVAPAPGRLTIRDPRLIPLALGAKPAGVDLGPLLQVLTANKPSVHIAPDGSTYDENDPAALGKRYAHPSVLKGRLIDENDPANIGKDFPEDIPFGWQAGADGKLIPTPGGPHDPRYQASLTAQRRDEIVARPMPTRTKAAAGAASWLPAGAKVVHLPGS